MFRRKQKQEELIHRENLDLSYRLKLAEAKNVALEEKWNNSWRSASESMSAQIVVWKERGDKYATHNEKLQQALVAIHTATVGILQNPSAYKEALELITRKSASNPESKKGE